MARTNRSRSALRVITFPFKILCRVLLVCVTALLLGVGGGMGTLGGLLRKIDKPDQENPIVCVDEESSERQ
jgi:hypothetical protein